MQHLKQQQASSAPQHMHLAMHMTRESTMMLPKMIATMTGHLSDVSHRAGSAGPGDYELAVCLGHALVPGRECVFYFAKGICARRDQRTLNK